MANRDSLADNVASPSGPASQAWLAAILEATPDAIIVVASDGSIVTVNAQAERLFGYSRHEVIGQSVDILLPERLRALHGEYRRAFAADPRIRPMGVGLDLAARRQDGREFPVEISLSPLYTASGLYVISAIRDVSERRLIEQEQARLAAIVEASHDAILSTTPDGIITSWNPAATRLFGYSATEAIGRSVTMLAPGRANEVVDNLDRLRRGEPYDNFETVRMAKDGHLLDVTLTGSPVRNHEGTVVGTATVFRDISARKQAEMALRESEQRFRGAFAAATIGMALVGLDGRFLQVNRALCEIVGYREDELRDLTFQLITHPDDLAADLSLVQQLLDGVIPNYSLEKRYIHKDGHIVWVLLSVSLVRNDAGEPLYFVSQIQDVTRAREAERVKDEFVSTVSHELRTPLTSIAGYVDLLLDGAAGEQPEEARHFLTIVQQNGRRLIALVNDLLDMSRIEAGQLGLLREEVDLAALLRQSAAGFAPEIMAKRQTLRLELPDHVPPLWADVRRIGQIISNLISNAHKYTPPEGMVTVAVHPETDAVRIDVSDTGIGLSEEELERLFTRFFRAPNRAARSERGTGLGLAITRALTELHGGTIAVRSAPGIGSTFSVTLPIRAAPPEQDASATDTAEAEPHAASVEEASIRLLVVEDDPDIANLLREFLLQEGYEVTIVATAAQAVASVRAAPPDLITLDLKLPDGDGWSVLDRLREAGVTVPPVVVVSILPENGYGKPLGVVDYLAKPIRGPMLRERVARALAAGRREDRMP